MSRSTLAAVGLIVLAGTARADEPAAARPQSRIQSAAQLAAASDTPRPEPPEAISLAFGVRVSRATDLVRRHLSLGHGVGLVVEDVAPGSPAARAGIQAYDVLVEVDGQTLIVPEQLAALTETTDAAAPRECVVIRAGTREVLSMNAAAPPPAAPKRPAPKRPLQPTPAVAAMLPENKPVAKASGIVRRNGEFGVVQEDADYSIGISREDETMLIVRDARGRVVFRDAIETPEQRSRIPLAVRDRVVQLESVLDRELRATARRKPVADIGRLDVDPIEVK